MPVRRILWPTDFSDAAAAALPVVQDLVRRDGAEVHLLYITESLDSFESYWGSGPDERRAASLSEFVDRRSRERLRALCDCELDGCDSFVLHFAQGAFAEEVLKAVDAVQPDLVVAGAPPVREPTAFGAAIQEVVARSTVPVRTVATGRSPEPPSCRET